MRGARVAVQQKEIRGSKLCEQVTALVAMLEGLQAESNGKVKIPASRDQAVAIFSAIGLPVPVVVGSFEATMKWASELLLPACLAKAGVSPHESARLQARFFALHAILSNPTTRQQLEALAGGLPGMSIEHLRLPSLEQYTRKGSTLIGQSDAPPFGIRGAKGSMANGSGVTQSSSKPQQAAQQTGLEQGTHTNTSSRSRPPPSNSSTPGPVGTSPHELPSKSSVIGRWLRRITQEYLTGPLHSFADACKREISAALKSLYQKIVRGVTALLTYSVVLCGTIAWATVLFGVREVFSALTTLADHAKEIIDFSADFYRNNIAP